jgi:hypothetical protein
LLQPFNWKKGKVRFVSVGGHWIGLNKPWYPMALPNQRLLPQCHNPRRSKKTTAAK